MLQDGAAVELKARIFDTRCYVVKVRLYALRKRHTCFAAWSSAVGVAKSERPVVDIVDHSVRPCLLSRAQLPIGIYEYSDLASNRIARLTPGNLILV